MVVCSEKRFLMSCCLHLRLLVLFTVAVAQSGQQDRGAPDGHHLTNAETIELLDQLVNNMDYRVRPNVDGEAVVISVSIFVISIGSINESDMDYSLDIYLRQAWYDSRLAFIQNSTRPLAISAGIISKMWTPDLFFPTEKRAYFHDVTVPNKLMRVYPDGRVIYSMRLTLTLACPMDLSHFPMDHQECDFMMESYAHEEEDVVLEWFETDAVEIADDIELPQFDLINATTMRCNAQKYKTGFYPCVKARFTLKRQYGFFLLQTYIPTILIVIISWISFWINMDAVPARISLGVTTVLTMATQLSGSKASIPRISYPKAIDIWMAVCMLFVFGALVEYAFVNALSRKDKRRREGVKKLKQEARADDGTAEVSRGRGRVLDECCTIGCCCITDQMKRQKAHTVDKSSRFLFPLTFLAFNLIYWPYYTVTA